MSLPAEGELLSASLSGSLPASMQQDFDRHREHGNAAFKTGDFTAAIRHYTDAELVNPLSPLPPANRAQVYLKMRNWQRAREEAAMALELQRALPPNIRNSTLTVKLLLRRATACKELMLVALAAEDYAAVLKLEPGNVLAKNAMQHLKERFHITAPASTRRHDSLIVDATPTSSRELIRVVSEDDVEPNKVAMEITSTGAEKERSRRAKSKNHEIQPSDLQDETELLALPSSVISSLTARWSSTPPQDAGDFQRAWRSLAHSADAQAQYLVRVVGPQRITSGVLGADVTAQFLMRVVGVLTKLMKKDPEAASEIVKVVDAVTKVERFDMIRLFLSEAESASVGQLLDGLVSAGVDAERASAIRTRFTC